MKAILALLILQSVILSSASSFAQTTPRDSCLLDPRYNNGAGNPLQGRIFDQWGRDLTNRVILLVDWEGYMGNPEPLFRILPPTEAQFPVTATLRVSGAPLLYFPIWWGALESDHSANGPSLQRTFLFPNEISELRIGNNPDRNFVHEEYLLHVEFLDANAATFSFETPIHVCDEDRDRPLDFQIILDVSLDQTGFYAAHPEAVSLMQQIADDIAYYLDDMEADTVPANSAFTIVNDNPRRVGINPVAYTGFYLFSTGWYNPNGVWSTGYPGNTFLQRDGAPLEVFAIGTVRPHPDGDRSEINTSGWSYERADTAWWKVSREIYGPSPTADCPPGESECNYFHVSFYSVMKHELLHALAYEPRYPRWLHFQSLGCIDDSNVVAHTGRCTPLADAVHAWDPVLHKRFWNAGVELLDDFELLVMQAVGWRLRETTPFMKLQFEKNTLSPARLGEEYRDRIAIRGGIPPFLFLPVSLPPGLTLNRFNGEITGTPLEAGTFSFSVGVKDHGVDNSVQPNGIRQVFDIDVLTNLDAPPSAIPDAYVLMQNFPNPFDPTTTIAFGLPSASFVSLKVFDALGREVSTLVSEVLAPGRYSRQWNSAGLPSGLYFYRLRAGDFVQTKSIVLLK